MKWGIVDASMICVSVQVSPQRPVGAYAIPENSAAGVGWCWEGWQWRSPRWTSYEFLRRFTWQERSAIRIAGFDDDAVADFLTLCTAAQEVVSDDPVTQAGMDYLVSLNLLTPARRAEILS